MLSPLPEQIKFLTTSEAAKFLHVSEQTLRNWTDEDMVHAYVTEGGHRRYTELDLMCAKQIIGCIDRGEEPLFIYQWVDFKTDGSCYMTGDDKPIIWDLEIKASLQRSKFDRAYEMGGAHEIKNHTRRNEEAIRVEVYAISKSNFNREMTEALEKLSNLLGLTMKELEGNFKKASIQYKA